MNGKIDKKEDYFVQIKINLGCMKVLLVIDKPSFSTLIGINDKNTFVNHRQQSLKILSDQEIEQLKKVRLNNELKPNQYYELTDILAQTC